MHPFFFLILLFSFSFAEIKGFNTTTIDDITTDLGRITYGGTNYEIGKTSTLFHDINGDGLADMISVSDSYPYAYVWYGNSAEPTNPKMAYSSANITVTGYTNTGFGMGLSSAGDFNDDGYNDFIISAPRYNSSKGQVYVFWGGNSISPSLSASLMSAVHGVRFTYSESDAPYFGNSVASLDFNGDGISDIAIGAPSALSQSGKVWILFGSSTAWNQLDYSETNFNSSNSMVIQPPVGAGRLGKSLSTAGFFNADGLEDLIIGAYSFGVSNNGAGFVIYGDGSPPPSLALSSLTSAQGIIINGASNGNYLGNTVASAGDINNDGLDDVLISAPYRDFKLTNAGEVLLIWGTDSSPATITISPIGANGLNFTGVAESRIDLCAGISDFNADGYNDFAITSPLINTNRGHVWIIFGGPGLTSGIDLTSFNASIHGRDFAGSTTNVLAGSSISGGLDWNGDGYNDTLIGANQDNYQVTRGGTTTIIFGQEPCYTLYDGWSCTACPAGKSGPTCQNCPLGTASNGTGQCIGCLPGTYADNPGSPQCTPCDLGEYQPNSNATGCIPCNPGSFADTSGQDACDPCSSGSWKGSSGASQCDDCTPGTYQPSPGATTSCLICNPGEYSGSGASGCSQCQPGDYQSQPGQGSCIQCPPGSVAPNPSSTFCDSCFPGTAGKEQNEACISCQPGEYSNVINATTCLACVDGQYTNTVNSTSCDTCDAGTTSNNIHTVCSDCEPGSYTNSPGMYPCPECAAGFYQDAAGATNCIKCQTPGSVCPVGSERPVPDYGWQNIDGSINEFAPCFPSEACPGGAFKCRQGYTPPTNLCSECSTDWYRINGKCQPCPGNTEVVAVALVIFYALFILILIPFGSRGHRFGMMSMVFSYLQIVALFGYFQVNADPLWESSFTLLSTALFNIELTSPECTGAQVNFYTIWLLQIMLPVLTIVLLAFYYMVTISTRTGLNAKKRSLGLRSGSGSESGSGSGSDEGIDAEFNRQKDYTPPPPPVASKPKPKFLVNSRPKPSVSSRPKPKPLLGSKPKPKPSVSSRPKPSVSSRPKPKLIPKPKPTANPKPTSSRPKPNYRPKPWKPNTQDNGDITLKSISSSSSSMSISTERPSQTFLLVNDSVDTLDLSTNNNDKDTSKIRFLSFYFSQIRDIIQNQPKSQLRKYFYGSIFFIIGLLYTIVTQASISILDCEPRGKIFVIGSHPEVRCYTPEYDSYSWIAYLILITFTFGIPLTIIGAFILNRHILFDKGTRLIFGCFVDKYSPEFAYWDAISLLRKAFILFITIFLNDNVIVSATIVLVLLLLSVAAQLYFRPFWTKWINRFEFMSLSSASIIVIFVLIMATNPTLDPNVKYGIAIANIVFIISSLVLGAYFGVRHYQCVLQVNSNSIIPTFSALTLDSSDALSDLPCIGTTNSSDKDIVELSSLRQTLAPFRFSTPSEASDGISDDDKVVSTL